MQFNRVNNLEQLPSVVVSGFLLFAYVADCSWVVELIYSCGGKQEHFVRSI